MTHAHADDQVPGRLSACVPLTIDRAEIEVVSLLIGGDAWSLSATCLWRWFDPRGRVITSESPNAADDIWDLVGDDIVRIDWAGPAALGVDPRLTLRSGGELTLLSDGLFDTWVMRAAGITVVGPASQP